MKTKIKYGNTIHSDNTIEQETKYLFTDIGELRAFWQNRKSISNTGSWTTNLPLMTVSLRVYVSSEEYFSWREGEPLICARTGGIIVGDEEE